MDNLAAETAATMTTQHPDYALLAARIAISNLHKESKKEFSSVMRDLYNLLDKKSGKLCPMISDKCMDIIEANKERLNSAIVYDRDFNYNYFGFKVGFYLFLLSFMELCLFYIKSNRSFFTVLYKIRSFYLFFSI